MFDIYENRYYKKVLEGELIHQVTQGLLDGFSYELKRLQDNQYIVRADESGITEREQGFSIIPDASTETLDFRRQRLLNRNTTKPPFTLEFLADRLNDLLGNQAYHITMDYPSYTLTLECSLDDVKLYQEIASTVERIKPANIINRLTWIRALPEGQIHLGAALQTGTQMRIYPIFGDDLSSSGEARCLAYYKQGTTLSIYPRKG